MNLYEWANKHNVSPEAIRDLKESMGLLPSVNTNTTGDKDESTVSKIIRLEAAQKGYVMWRNNVGALQNQNGAWVRYGLANESKQMNTLIKSSDLIGISPDGQFVAREVKAEGWRYMDKPHEVAQNKFIQLVNSKGGDAQFATGEGTL